MPIRLTARPLAARPLAGWTLAALAFAAPAGAFDVQGHRGARGLAPENTLPGFARALAVGVDTLELDLALTKDGVLVVHHDVRLNPDLARRPDGAYVEAPGPAIRALTLDELRRYDVGRIRPDSAYAKSFPDQAPVDGALVPTLGEVLTLAVDTGAPVNFNIETKLTPTSGLDAPDPGTFARAVAEAVRATGLNRRITVQSFDWRTLQILRGIAPEIRRACLTSEQRGFDTVQRGRPGGSPWLSGLDVDDFGGSTPRLVAAAGCAVWSPNARDLTAERVAEAKGMGLAVLPWTVNDRGDMARLIAWGVDGLITDYPNRLRAVLSAQGLGVPDPVRVRQSP